MSFVVGVRKENIFAGQNMMRGLYSGAVGVSTHCVGALNSLHGMVAQMIMNENGNGNGNENGDENGNENVNTNGDENWDENENGVNAGKRKEARKGEYSNI